MKQNLILDQNAKNTFSEGISYYTAGTAMLNSLSSSIYGIRNCANPVGILQKTAKDALTAIPLFFSSTNNLLDFGKEHNIKNTEELQQGL